MRPDPRHFVIKEGRGLHINVYGEVHRHAERGQPSVEPGRATDTKRASYEGGGFGEILKRKSLQHSKRDKLCVRTEFCKIRDDAVRYGLALSVVDRTLTSLKRRAQEVLGWRTPGSTVLVPRDHENHCVSLRAEVGIVLSCARNKVFVSSHLNRSWGSRRILSEERGR
jgi:hypothetical protein